MYKSDVYGGTVFMPIGRMKDGKNTKRESKNPLEEEIKKQPISLLYGGGFYVLKNIKYAANVYIDVWLLVEAIDDAELMGKFNIYNNLSEAEKRKKDPLNFMDLKKHMNGYGRIIYYT